MSQVGRWTKGTLAIALVVLASLASPWVALSAAQAGGADKPRSETFGDCPHENAGVHNGYDCEEEIIPTLGGGLT